MKYILLLMMVAYVVVAVWWIGRLVYTKGRIAGLHEGAAIREDVIAQHLIKAREDGRREMLHELIAENTKAIAAFLGVQEERTH